MASGSWTHSARSAPGQTAGGVHRVPRRVTVSDADYCPTRDRCDHVALGAGYNGSARPLCYSVTHVLPLRQGGQKECMLVSRSLRLQTRPSCRASAFAGVAVLGGSAIPGRVSMPERAETAAECRGRLNFSDNFANRQRRLDGHASWLFWTPRTLLHKAIQSILCNSSISQKGVPRGLVLPDGGVNGWVAGTKTVEPRRLATGRSGFSSPGWTNQKSLVFERRIRQW